MSNRYTSLADYLASKDKQTAEIGLGQYVKQFGAKMAAEEAWDACSFIIMGHTEPDEEIVPDKMWTCEVHLVNGFFAAKRIEDKEEVVYAYFWGIKDTGFLSAQEFAPVEDVKAWFINVFTDFLKTYFDGE